MLVKAPSYDWTEQDVEYIIVEEDAQSEVDSAEDFEEYMWMENEEEFNESEMKRLEDEECMRECMEAMLEDELEAEIAAYEKARKEQLNLALSALPLSSRCASVENSSLNPHAAEFIPLAQRLAAAFCADSVEELATNVLVATASTTSSTAATEAKSND